MLIAEFAKVTGVSIDTIRFYIARGLLIPTAGKKGGSRPYQVFNQADVTTLEMIKLQKSLGFSLREIAKINAGYNNAANNPNQTLEVLSQQIIRLEEKLAAVESAISFLREKSDWIIQGKPADSPDVKKFYC